MQQINLHKQRLITVAIAALGLIFLFLPWVKLAGQSNMGYVVWGGIISALAFAAVIANSILLGDKTKPFDKQGKLIAIIAFAVAFLFTIIVLIVSNGTTQVQQGFYVFEVKRSAGIGVWLTLILEIGGLVFISGILDQLLQQKAGMNVPNQAPPPPPPPKR